MKRIYLFDKQGFFAGDEFLSPDDKGQYVMPKNATSTQPKAGLHRPKWDGKAWIEGLDAATALQNAMDAKTYEINKSCNSAIVGGFMSSALGTKHLYDSALEDQLNLVGAAGAGIDLPYSCTDLGTGIKAEVMHTAAQIKQVYGDGIAFKQAQLSKCRRLKAAIQAAKTVADVQKVVW